VDFLFSPFETLFDWIGYFLLFGAGIIALLTIGAIVAIPLGLKLLGVAFAKTIVVETSKVVRDLGLDKIKVDTDKLPIEKFRLTSDDLKNVIKIKQVK
jgi:hypothetical protein